MAILTMSDYIDETFRVGHTRQQPSPYFVNKPYTGSSIVTQVSGGVFDMPASWSVSLILKGDDRAYFKEFLSDLFSVNNDTPNLFYADVVLGYSRETKLLRIIGGIPQPLIGKMGVARYSFNIYCAEL